jgi:hypothetical protein
MKFFGRMQFEQTKMAKHKDQTIKELKREVEALRAQLKVAPKKEAAYQTMENAGLIKQVRPTSASHSPQNEYSSSYNIDLLLDDNYIKTQLSKTIVLTAFSFAVILGVYFYGVDKILHALPI